MKKNNGRKALNKVRFNCPMRRETKRAIARQALKEGLDANVWLERTARHALGLDDLSTGGAK